MSKITGWKKSKSYKDSWANMSKHLLLNIFEVKDKHPNNSFYSTLYYAKYGVDITSTEWPLSVLIRKSFRTKEDAKNFAINYMKMNR